MIQWKKVRFERFGLRPINRLSSLALRLLGQNSRKIFYLGKSQWDYTEALAGSTISVSKQGAG